MSRQRITVALLWGKYSGPMTSVNDLTTALDPSRFRVLFLYLSDEGGQDNHLAKAGFPVIYLSAVKRLNAFRPGLLMRLVKAIRREKIDILHCHAHKPTFYGVLAGWVCPRVCVLGHVHGLNRSASIGRKLTNWFLFRRINRLLPVAEAVKRDLLACNWGLSASKVTVLENSIDFDRFTGNPTTCDMIRKTIGLSVDSYVFGTVGRLAPTKGIQYLIAAFAKVKKSMPRAELIFLGDGRCRAEYEKLAAETGYAKSIHFLGHRPDVVQLYRAMDVFVLASIAEGMPRCILEAMASGIPVVAARVGGIPEILGDDQYGILARPADPDSLAEAMCVMARMTTDKRAELIALARCRVRDVYSHTVVGEKLRQIFHAEYGKYHPEDNPPVHLRK